MEREKDIGSNPKEEEIGYRERVGEDGIQKGTEEWREDRILRRERGMERK